MANNVSIEYAHIYTNNRIDDDHETSISILNELKAELEQNNETMTLVVMVDDYSFPDPTFDYDSFSVWLAERGFKPDVMPRESQLIPLCDQVLGMIDDEKLKKPIVDYIKAKKYPCSLFIAAWYLLRLGHLESDLLPKNLVADRLINILPTSFKPFEDKGLQLIAATPYNDAVNKISYRFFEGRLIA